MFVVIAILPALLLLMGFPIIVVLLASAAIMLVSFFPIPPTALHQVLFGSLDSFALLAIPFFIFAGEVMGQGGISRRIVDWAGALFGRMRGSLAMTTVGASVAFGVVSGSAPATVAAVGRLTLNPMIAAGYDKRFATGLLTSSGLIDNVLPPSVAMIIFAAVAEVSVIRLFTAGFLPGLLISAMFLGYIWWVCRRANITEAAPFRLRNFLHATRDGFWALAMPVIVLGGIYAGLFSPTEAGGVACVYAVVVSVFVYREIPLSRLFDIAVRAAFLTAQIMIIVAAAGVFAWILTTSGVSAFLSGYFGTLNLPAWAILLGINILLLIAGAFLDTVSSILLLTPLLLPIVLGAGIDPIHFGVMMTVNLSIGMFTPPFGVNIFVAQSVFKQPLSVIYAGIWPFIVVSVAALAIITYVPQISLLLPSYVQ